MPALFVGYVNSSRLLGLESLSAGIEDEKLKDVPAQVTAWQCVQTSQWTCPWCLPSFREEGGRESKIASIVLKTFLPGLRLAGACGPVPRTRYFGVKRGWLAVHDLTCYPKVVARGPGGVFLTGAGSGWRILCGTAVGGWWTLVASVVTAGPAGPPAAGSESLSTALPVAVTCGSRTSVKRPGMVVTRR